MKLKIYILFAALFLSTGFYSCTKDPIDATDEEKNRMFSTMFRTTGTTGLDNDERASQVIGTNRNDIYLSWYGVYGAAGYRIQMRTGSSPDWVTNTLLLMDTIVGPDVLRMTIKDLQYGVTHRFRIQTLSPRGEAYNSRWWGEGGSRSTANQCALTTDTRQYPVPTILTINNRTQTSVKIDLDLAHKEGYPDFNAEDGKFVMDQIELTYIANNALQRIVYDLTDTDKANGYIELDGLLPNTVYTVNGMDNSIPRYWDKIYNTERVRMLGVVGEPILIEHVADTAQRAIPWNASRIDTILNNYMNDSNLAEGTTFLLEGGKTYYLGGGVNMEKGFTLRSNDPLAPATVLMNMGFTADGKANTASWNFGRVAEPGEMGTILVTKVEFENILFNAPDAYNYYRRPAGTEGTSNYFTSGDGEAMNFKLDSFVVKNCEFKNFIRIVFRSNSGTAGSTGEHFFRVIDNWIVEDCFFHDCGHLDAKGRGLATGGLFSTDNSRYSNIYKNLLVKNCTFLDSAFRGILFQDPRANTFAWPDDTKWNISILNCTFLNWNTINNGTGAGANFIFNLQYPPKNSKFTVKDNLFILARKPDDVRTLYALAMFISNYPGGLSFDIANNWSTNAHLTSGEIWSARPFSHTASAAGYMSGTLNVGGKDSLVTKVAAIAPDELMVNPFAKVTITSAMGSTAGDKHPSDTHSYNLDGLYYQNTATVKASDIYTRNIGDPRWRKNVTP